MTLPCLLVNPFERKTRMQFDANVAPARAIPVSGQAGSSIAHEIDLYDELLAFVDMTPEDQRLYLADTTAVSEAPEPAELEAAGPEPAEPETVGALDPDTAVASVESPFVFADSTPLDEELDEKLDAVVELSDVGDPLADLNLDGPFTDVLPGKGCLACGAESAADDLFCMSCGSFLNGIASNSPSNPVCGDCSQGITIDEIFCPWCGSVLAAS
jgi:hypothetical protein